MYRIISETPRYIVSYDGLFGVVRIESKKDRPYQVIISDQEAYLIRQRIADTPQTDHDRICYEACGV